MMKNNENMNAEFEKLFKSKMDELASSVDCFDKISKKAFPEQNAVFSDDEYTISDFENITGQKKRFNFAPFAALAAAAAVCVFILPKNNTFMDFVYSNVCKSEKKIFREIIDEINYELEHYDYSIFECTLEEYISHDVLITPLSTCPFEESEKDDINIRIFTKMNGSMSTAQIYAVEYEGDYENNNIIAAADSQIKLTDEDLSKFDSEESSYSYFYSTGLFNVLEETLADNNGNPVTVSEIAYPCIYKVDGETVMLNSKILYWHRNDDTENTEYFYDIAAEYQQDENVITYLSNFDDTWKNIIYFNGASAAAETELSVFNKTDIFSSDTSWEENMSIVSLQPFSQLNDSESIPDLKDTVISLYNDNDDEIGNIIPPVNKQLQSSWIVFVVNNGSHVTLRSSNEAIESTYSSDSFSSTNGYQFDSEIDELNSQESEKQARDTQLDEEQAKIAQNIEEMEKYARESEEITRKILEAENTN